MRGLRGFSRKLGSLYISGPMFKLETATLTIQREGCSDPHLANAERGDAHPRSHGWQVGSLSAHNLSSCKVFAFLSPTSHIARSCATGPS